MAVARCICFSRAPPSVRPTDRPHHRAADDGSCADSGSLEPPPPPPPTPSLRFRHRVRDSFGPIASFLSSCPLTGVGCRLLFFFPLPASPRSHTDTLTQCRPANPFSPVLRGLVDVFLCRCCSLVSGFFFFVFSFISLVPCKQCVEYRLRRSNAPRNNVRVSRACASISPTTAYDNIYVMPFSFRSRGRDD